MKFSDRLFYHGFLRRLLYFQVRRGHEFHESRRTVEPDGGVLGQRAFNVALQTVGGITYGAFRRVDSAGEHTLCLARFDAASQPDPQSLQTLDTELARLTGKSYFEDPRFFRHSGQDYLLFHCKGALYLVHIDIPGARILGVPRRLIPTRDGIPCPLPTEKNWTLFEDRNEIYAIYSISPFRILKLTNWEAPEPGAPLYAELYVEHALPPSVYRKRRNPFGWRHRTFWNPFQWGEPRGGTPPLQIGSNYFLFFHSYSYIKSYGTYSLLGFSTKPPFRPTYFPKHPVGFPLPKERRTTLSMNFPLTLLFPCSASYDAEHREWTVATGRDDICMDFFTHKHEKILQSCQPVDDHE